jgi:hypothetical protein
VAIRSTAALVLVLLISACGGTTGTGITQAPGATATPTTGGQATPPNPGTGESIDSDGVAAALTALQGLDSWTFEVKTWTKSLGETREQDVSGTQRKKPEVAVDAIHTSPSGEFRYIRIGDDLWTNLGTDVFYHYAAADSETLISQYEPLYVNGLAGTVAGFSRIEYEPVGPETIHGISTVHYRASETDREYLVQSYSGITADQWAADIWLAVDGGYIVRLAWGPQTLDTAQASMGFLYETTSVNCACPIEPPTNVASP